MQGVLLRAKGLYTFPNYLSEIPEGSLTVADNVVIDRNGIIEPRRGFAQYGDTFGIGTDRAKQLFTYKNRILRHYNSTLQFDNGSGTFKSFSGDFLEPEAGIRIKSVEANSNFYFTTATGIKKISAASASDFTDSVNFIKNAGAAKALDVTGIVNYTTLGFLTSKSKVAYRVRWGYKDANNNLILGAPSSRLVLTNFSDTKDGTTQLTFTIPSEITASNTEYFYQIYRTAVFQAPNLSDLDSIDPGDEMNLVIEGFPTTTELTTTRIVTVSDITPDDFREGGALLETNPVSGQGILQSNEPPPLAKDIAVFQNTVFYANTKTKHNLEISLLSVSQLVSETSTISISNGDQTDTYTFRGAKEVTEITCVDDVSSSLNNKYFFLNSAGDVRKYYIWFSVNNAGVDPNIPGRLGIKIDIQENASKSDIASAIALALPDTKDFVAIAADEIVTVSTSNNGNTSDDFSEGDTGFTFDVVQQGTGEDVASKFVLLSDAPTPSQQIDETARSLVNIINKQSDGLVDAFYLSGPDDVPGMILLQARGISDPEFYVTTDSTPTGSQFNPELPTSGTSVNSDNEVEPNALYYSKFQEPEAVPIVNKFYVGSKNKEILRILALRDSLFVLKEDGIFRVTGQAGAFVLDPFDTSAILKAPDSAVVLNNQIYMLSTQGVVTVTDTGVSVISRQIEDQILKVISSNYSFYTNTFGVAYESDRSYMLWTVTNPTDTVPTQCFRYNTFTNAWTRFPIAKTCGVINPANDTLYLGVADGNFIEKERKNFKRTDYADRELSLTIPFNAIASRRITLSNSTAVEPGDVIAQEQYLTIYQFNYLLKKLDIDPGVKFNDYYTTLAALPGDNLRNKVNSLAEKLDADPGIDTNTFVDDMTGGQTFQEIQADFNSFIQKLNLDSGANHSNYRESDGTKTFEVIITSKVKNSNAVNVQFNMPFVEGPITLYKGIEARVVWAPQSFGDPSIQKHIREGTMLFENTVFFRADVAYSTDLSPNFDPVDFEKAGIGDWGAFNYGQQNWGGTGSGVPLRTLIPRDKQRCRYIITRFNHSAAREKFAILGISFTLKPISERAYRS